MKKIFSFMLLLFFGQQVLAQAILPSSWDFSSTTLPTGWSINSATQVDYYPASGNPAPAMKFFSTGGYLVINFNGAPGTLTYDLVGNNFSGGTFSVEESDLGTTWTTLRTITSPNSTYTNYTDNPSSSSRYIRFIYTNKVTGGGNVGLDNVSIAAPVAGPEQEINVVYSGTTIISGGTQVVSSAVSTMTPYTFTVENLGTDSVLTISSAVISGTNAADFTVASYPSTVTASGTGSLVVNFTPAAAGTRTAVLTINNNDTDEGAYVINLYGVGGSYASEPTAQPTALNFSSVKTYRVMGSFTPSTADGFIVLRKKGSAVTEVPVDGTSYLRGDYIGAAQVVYSANAASIVPNNIVAGTDYYFAVFAYNGPDGYRNYLTSSPLTGNVTTPATMMPTGYYSSISETASTFVTDLHNLVNPHTMQYYSNYANLMIKQFAARDTSNDQRVVTCVYSGENKVYTEPFDFTTYGYSREHTYCHSWMPTYSASNTTSLPEYNDYHHLFPTNQDNANGIRSNYPLGVVATLQFSYLGDKFGLDANGHKVFEPRDSHKGDAARALFYEAICYNGVSGNDWSLPAVISSTINYGQDQAILKQWHFNDLPDNYEIARNDYVDSLQDNRNPFIDNPDYVCFIDFSTMAYNATGCTAAIEEVLNNTFYVYPNPAKDVLTLNVDNTIISSYEIIDAQGRQVLAGDVNNLVMAKVDVSTVKTGTYIVKVNTPYGAAIKTIVIE